MLPQSPRHSSHRLRLLAERTFEETREAMRESVRLHLQSSEIRRAVAAGMPVLPAIGAASAPAPHVLARHQLSPREVNVLRMVAEGKSTRQIARELGLSFKTVSTHRCAIMSKLDVHKSAAMIREAYRLGLI